MAGRELQTTIVINGRAAPSFSAAMRFAQSEAGKTASKLNKYGQSIGNIFSKIGQAGLIVGAPIVYGLGVVAKNAVKMASDLKEVQNVVDTTFGKSAQQINQFAQSAKNSFGLSQLQAKQMAGTYGAMIKSSGLAIDDVTLMSKGLTGLTGDFASFYNLEHQEAFEKLRAGIAGETEPLRQLGINMTVANLEAYALSKGIKTSYQKMDQASQMALRYSYLMNVSKDAQGDFAKTQKEFANQNRLLSVNFNELTTKIGAKLLPTLNKGVIWANNFVTSLLNNPAKMKAIESAVMGAADSIIKFGNEALPYVKDFGNFVLNNGGTITTTILGIGVGLAAWKVGSAVYDMYQFVGALNEARKVYPALIALKLTDKAETLYLQGLYAKDAIVMGAKTLGMWAMTAATGAWSAITAIATGVGTAFGAVLAFITSPIGLVILAIGALIGVVYLLYKNWGAVTSFFSSLWSGIKSIFASGVNYIIGLLNKISFTIPDWVPGVGGKHFGVNIKPMKTYAQGGFANQPSIFGEAGPEAAIPIKRNNPRSIALLNQTAQMLGVGSRSGGNSISLTFAPTISGGGSVSENRSMLDDAFESYKREIKELFADERWLAFNE